MIDTALVEQIGQYLRRYDFFLLLVIVATIGMYFYWSESKTLQKRRNDTFDGWFLSLGSAALFGRIAYVVGNWAQFVDSYWFYLPYEKYAGDIYLFRAMPWKLITIWDGGFLFTGMLFGFLLGSLFFMLRLKKWAVREMVNPITLSTFWMMGSVFLIYGLILNIGTILDTGLYLIAGLVLLKFMNRLLRRRFKKSKKKRRNAVALMGVIHFISSSYLAINTFLSQTSLTAADNVSLYGYVGLSIIFLITVMIDLNKEGLHPASLVTSGTPATAPSRNQAIKPGALDK